MNGGQGEKNRGSELPEASESIVHGLRANGAERAGSFAHSRFRDCDNADGCFFEHALALSTSLPPRVMHSPYKHE